MGFTTGLLGGFTLTTSVLYLSLQLHRRNRLQQSALLSQQTQVLVGAAEFTQPFAKSPHVREVQLGAVDTAKDRWNKELEANVKKIQNADWSALRERLEDSVSGVFRKAFASGRDTLPDAPKK